ncbi:hypothetical protein CEY02_13120 [Bacillus pumilus]|uniref:Uncharacterized protein n=1 Tax=Bacillus pumilus TaxID=1408 RepID=A0A2A5IUR6_BACPU|nr:hypothetical protein [Bacillus pumilus]PCK20471.1 hypothetical protein CEY02_13120 [Bacillus pumilus]
MIQKSRTKRLPYFTQTLLYDAEWEKSTYLEGEGQTLRLSLSDEEKKADNMPAFPASLRISRG